MDLDDRHRDGRHGVAQCDRVMRERAGIQHDAAEPLAGGALQPVDQLALDVRLPALHPHPTSPPRLPYQAVDVGQGHPSIDGGLPGPEQIEIGAMQNERGAHRHRPPE